jgi:hypothetical protein
MKANTWAMCSVTPAHLGWFTQFSAVRGNPVLLQSRFGQQGNFELAVPAATGGGLLFSWRNNDDPSLPWAPVFRFGEFMGNVDEITLIQSNFGSPGNLELIARVGDQLFFLWRDSGPAFQWNGPWPLLTVPAGAAFRAAPVMARAAAAAASPAAALAEQSSTVVLSRE